MRLADRLMVSRPRVVSGGTIDHPLHDADWEWMRRQLQGSRRFIADDVVALWWSLAPDAKVEGLLGPMVLPYPRIWVEGAIPPASNRGANAAGVLLTQPRRGDPIKALYTLFDGRDRPRELRTVVAVAEATVEEDRIVSLDQILVHPWDEFSKDALLCALWPGLMTVGLVNCRNVGVVDASGAPAMRKAHRKRHGADRLRMSRIVLPRPRGGGGTAGPGAPSYAPHLVRGHFKTYTADAPLFGRHTGTYWWSWHVAGDPSLGRVEPEYHVTAR